MQSSPVTTKLYCNNLHTALNCTGTKAMRLAATGKFLTMKAHDGSVDRFSATANLYASSRPTYPPSLLHGFVSRIPEASRKRALDVAAGSGQLTVQIAQYFENVVALDKSEGQLKHGPRLANITYQVGVATKLPSADEINGQASTPCFDVVTCAQAYHWFVAENIDEEFLEEACRVLHPDHGQLGIFGYGICEISSSQSLEEIFKKFYYERLGSNLPPSSPDCYWDMDRRLLDNSLEGICTYDLVEIVKKSVEVERRKIPWQEFLNYVRTFSALSNLQTKCAAQGEMDPMEKLHQEFEANAHDDEILDVDFPFFLIVMKPIPRQPIN